MLRHTSNKAEPRRRLSLPGAPAVIIIIIIIIIIIGNWTELMGKLVSVWSDHVPWNTSIYWNIVRGIVKWMVRHRSKAQETPQPAQRVMQLPA
jgi:hypothetical protein